MPTTRPSEMDRDTFVAAFGGIFEHSAPGSPKAPMSWNWGRPMTPPRACISALARVFRTRREEQRLGVLTAHPDLAGKLAAGQAPDRRKHRRTGLGRARCADRRRTRDFTTLNAAYTAKFGFPFIIAVRDNTKASIMEAFHRRIDNDRDTEFAEACRQVERIAELRLIEKFAR